MPDRADPEAAAKTMRGAGFDPVQPYPGSGEPWRCRCTRCGRVVSVKLVNIKRGFTDCSGCKDDERVAVMANVGLVPLEPYPGTGRPWRCRHVVCGREVSPYFNNVRRGLSKGCIYCSGLATTDHQTAAAEARAAGYEPLDPYPGLAKTKWRCRCMRCRAEVWLRLEKIRAGEGCCMKCGIEASAASRRADTQQSVDLMRAAGLEPMEPYPGSNHLPWLCQCMGCGAQVSPTRANIWRGQGGCGRCGIKISAASRLGNAEQAVLDMAIAGLHPLEPYPGFNKPWHCRCNRCGTDVWPRLAHVRSRGGGCLECGYASSAAKQLGDPTIAAFDMREAGFEPLDPYPGAAHPWRCRHAPCGNEVTPQLQKIRSGEGGCAHCASYGFNLTKPAIVYVLHHEKLGGVKIGITGSAERIERFGRHGWVLTTKVAFTTGAAARAVEQAVLRHVRDELGLSHHLTAEQMMGHGGGWTETFNASLLSPTSLCQFVDVERNQLRV